MKIVFALVSLLGVLLMAAILYAAILGDGWSEIEMLAEYAWFWMSILDLYVGLALFAVWIWFRERNPLQAAMCIVPLLLLGNLFACAYVLWALVNNQGDWEGFWLGRRAK